MTVHRLTKHHGLGNDFLIAINPEEPVTPAQAVSWCDRRTGIGADGLMVGSQVGGEWQMVLWNADGSRPEISGNGIRCLAQAIVLAGGAEGSDNFQIRTDAGPRTLSVLFNDSANQTMTIRAGMGQAVDGPPPSDRWSSIGIEPLAQVTVDVGNPHLVAVVESLRGAEIAAIGPAIEADYPAGINVHLVEITSPTSLELLIWERGAGVTQACGSGACASVWATNRLGLVGDQATVSMPGGDATVELANDEIFLTGPATMVGEVLVNG